MTIFGSSEDFFQTKNT